MYEIQGRQVTMPVEVRDASAGTVMFEVDAAEAQTLVPGEGFTVVESAPGRAQLNLAVIDYRDNDLGDYLEIGVTLFVAPSGLAADSAGTFITHLPVNQSFTCEAGRRIWGFPKSVEEMTFDYADDRVNATLHMDGQLVLDLTLPRGGTDEMPDMEMTTYTFIDGRPHGTAFTQGGSRAQVVPGGEGVELKLGEHPLARQLDGFGVDADDAQLTTWTEHMHGTFARPQEL